jgi:hypothetical protein
MIQTSQNNGQILKILLIKKSIDVLMSFMNELYTMAILNPDKIKNIETQYTPNRPSAVEESKGVRKQRFM